MQISEDESCRTIESYPAIAVHRYKMIKIYRIPPLYIIKIINAELTFTYDFSRKNGR
jgi:hypothetical protein